MLRNRFFDDSVSAVTVCNKFNNFSLHHDDGEKLQDESPQSPSLRSEKKIS